MDGILQVADLGRRAYGPVLALQEQLVAARQRDERPDTLLCVEHTPVYTLGRTANRAHILLPPDELQRRGIEVFEIGRGGDVTYHGPGQLVVYPILKLDGAERRVLWYVGCLEQTIVRVLADYGIAATLDRQNRGVWVGDAKIAALGVRITRHVTMHGFALNVAVELGYYAGIVPCGIADRGVTSLNRFVPGVTLADAQSRVRERFMQVFGYTDWEPAAL